MKKLSILLVMIMIASSAWAWQPKKEIELVVGFPPGGSTDLIARAMADGFNRQGVKTVVINRPGAGGAIATKQVMDSRADGHVVMLTGTSFVFNYLLKSAGATYDPLIGLDHLRLIGTVENHIYANSSGVTGDIKTVLNDLKTKNKNYSVGVTNPGAEFTAKLIENKLGITLKIVRYSGSAQASTDLLGGHVDLVIDSGTGILSRQPDETRVRFLATVNAKTADNRPNVDSVLAGIRTNSWFGMSLPAGSSPEIVKFYNELMVKTISDPKTRSALNDLGLAVSGKSDLQKVISEDLVRFAPIANDVAKP